MRLKTMAPDSSVDRPISSNVSSGDRTTLSAVSAAGSATVASGSAMKSPIGRCVPKHVAVGPGGRRNGRNSSGLRQPSLRWSGSDQAVQKTGEAAA